MTIDGDYTPALDGVTAPTDVNEHFTEIIDGKTSYCSSGYTESYTLSGGRALYCSRKQSIDIGSIDGIDVIDN